MSCLVVSLVPDGCIVVAMFIAPYVLVNLNPFVSWPKPICHSDRGEESRFRPHPIRSPSSALPASNHPAQENVAHLMRDRLRIGINPWIVPGINPVHHPKQTQHRYPSRELQFSLPLQIVK